MEKKSNSKSLGKQKKTGFLLAPMYLFTLLFVGLPFVYLFVLSFLQIARATGATISTVATPI